MSAPRPASASRRGMGGAHPEERTTGGAASAAPEERHEAEADMKETGAVRLPVAESQPAMPPEVSDRMENGEGSAAGACAAEATMYTELLAAVASVEPSTEGRPMSTTARSWHARAFTPGILPKMWWDTSKAYV